jgi:hypothetical protein
MKRDQLTWVEGAAISLFVWLAMLFGILSRPTRRRTWFFD